MTPIARPRRASSSPGSWNPGSGTGGHRTWWYSTGARAASSLSMPRWYNPNRDARCRPSRAPPAVCDRGARPGPARAGRGRGAPPGERSVPKRLEHRDRRHPEPAPGRPRARGRRRRRTHRARRPRPWRPATTSCSRGSRRAGAARAARAGGRRSARWPAPALLAGTLLDGTTRLSLDGRPVHHYSFLSTFAERTVVPEASCVRIRDDAPFPVAALVGCAVTTGVGAVLNRARVAAGSFGRRGGRRRRGPVGDPRRQARGGFHRRRGRPGGAAACAGASSSAPPTRWARTMPPPRYGT